MYLDLLKAFASGAGSKFGGKVFELFAEQEARLREIQEKLKLVYDEVLELGLKQHLAQHTVRRTKVITDAQNFQSLLRATKPPPAATLDELERRYISTAPDSYHSQLAAFLIEVLGAKSNSGIITNTFLVDPRDFADGAVAEYSNIMLCKGGVPINQYVEHMASFAACLIADLDALSKAYSLGCQVLKTFGRLEGAEERLEIVDRWKAPDGLVREFMPLLGECFRTVARPVGEICDVAGGKHRKLIVSLVLNYKEFIIENQPGGKRVRTGTPAKLKAAVPELSSANPKHGWELVTAVCDGRDRDAISLKALSLPDNYLITTDQQIGWLEPLAKIERKERASWRLIVLKPGKKDAGISFELRRIYGDRVLAVKNSIGSHIGLIDPEVCTPDSILAPGGEQQQFRFVFWSDRLYRDAFLRAGEALTSLNKRYALTFDAEKGLQVLEDGREWKTLWSPPDGVSLPIGARMVVGLDRLHIFADSRGLVDYSTTAAASPDQDRVLIMQIDGNVVLYHVDEQPVPMQALADSSHPISVAYHPPVD